MSLDYTETNEVLRTAISTFLEDIKSRLGDDFDAKGFARMYSGELLDSLEKYTEWDYD